MADTDEIVTTTDILQGWEGKKPAEDGKDHRSAEDQGLMPEQQQGCKHN